VTSILNFESEELGEVCDATCALAAADHLKLKSLSSGDDLSFVAMQGKLVMARVTAPLGQEPAAIAVSNKDTKKSAIARRTVKPGQNVNELQVDMTIMDQTTAQRNYGNRIAKRYIAITLDVRNPTAKKVQFNKSAMYFDVDYVESKERKPNLREYFRETVAVASTLGMYQPSVYKPPFVARNPPRVARFGLEQNVRHSPVNYLSALGSFDYTAEKTDEKLRALELIGSLLSNIATGAIVADRSGAFRAGTSVFSATFLPGFRALTLNTSAINRLRSNLVAQTLQETIQVPAEGASTTIALLPRTGILSFTDAEIPVMVKRVIDVHLVPEVVIPVTEMPVQKGACQPGYRKDQARQAFGEPTGLITNPDGSSTFVYAKGPVASADFDTKGVLANCKPRTPTEQLNLATTLVEANEILSDLKLAPTKIDITDGSVVLVDIPGIQPTYHFDAKGNRAADYTFLFNDITAEKEKPKDDFDTFMESKAASLSSARSSQIKVRAADAAKNFKPGVATRYESPDIQWGWIDVVFKNTGTGKTVSLVVDQIIFHGDKPKAVN